MSTECFVIFKTKEDAIKATNKHMEKLGNRFIEVIPAGMKDLEVYINRNFSNTMPVYTKDNMPQIPHDRKKSTLMVTGMEYKTTK